MTFLASQSNIVDSSSNIFKAQIDCKLAQYLRDKTYFFYYYNINNFNPFLSSVIKIYIYSILLIPSLKRIFRLKEKENNPQVQQQEKTLGKLSPAF